MRMYFANRLEGKVTPVEALIVSDTYIYLMDKKRRAKVSKKGAYFREFFEAKHYLIMIKERETIRAREAFYARQDELKALQSLKE